MINNSKELEGEEWYARLLPGSTGMGGSWEVFEKDEGTQLFVLPKMLIPVKGPGVDLETLRALLEFVMRERRASLRHGEVVGRASLIAEFQNMFNLMSK